jgi:hypothetical protein
VNRLPLLQTRLALLGNGVDEVANVLTVVQANHAALLSASSAVERATYLLSQLISVAVLEGQIDTLERFRMSEPEGSNVAVALDGLLEKVRASADAVGEIRAYLNTARESIDRLNSRAIFPPGRELDDEHPLRRAVRKGVERSTALIRSVERTVQPADERHLHNGWDEFNEKVARTVDDLFAEYLDLLGGIAIRERGIQLSREDAGYVDELCVMTDRLIRDELTRMGPSTWTLALPAHGFVGASSWPVVRMALSQWSVWAMPLEAFQFGQLAAAVLFEDEADDAWAKAISRYGKDGLRVLVGDVFASWAVGPAYACALVFLRLDPAFPTVDKHGPTDAERAALVERCLKERYPAKRLPRPEPVGYDDYFTFLDAVFQEWESARRLMGGVPLDDETLERLSEFAADVQERLGVKDGFALPDWRLAAETWTALDSKGSFDPLRGIRHLLNAAWFGLHGGGQSGGVKRDILDIERLIMTQGRAIAFPGQVVNNPDGRTGKKAGQPSGLSPSARPDR